MKNLKTAIIIIIINSICSCLLHAGPQPVKMSRQIHLDFHTSEYIEDIGKHFSKAQFQKALRIGNVNLINIFAKGHHGWSYYPTKVGQMHPNLNFDLLGAQIKACHEIGVRCPIYFTIGWSDNDGRQHPDWCMRNKDGSLNTRNDIDFSAKPDDPKPNSQWYNLCVGTGYHDHIMDQVKELCENYDIDGLWFDIYQAEDLCYCKACSKGMKEQGINTDDTDAVVAYKAQITKKHQWDLQELVKRYHPQATFFHNGTNAIWRTANFLHRMYEYNSYQDLEDLPTTWGGYDKLPVQSKYFLKAGFTITAMSGKFHTSWGEFGGFKHPNAILYEAASMIAWGANCNFGDQLHPSGEMDLATYENIGKAYAYVEKIEDYGIGGIPVARLAVWRSFKQNQDEGLTKLLLEAHINFDIANDVQDLSQFDVLVIPSVPCLTNEQAQKINEFVKQGGSLIVLAEGALDKNYQKFILDVGAAYLGGPQYDIDYLLLSDKLSTGLISSPFLNYEPAIRVKPDNRTEILASIREPYFSRTYGKYSSHQNTPYKLHDASFPGIIKNGNVIFFAHGMDTMYLAHGARLHRDTFVKALRMLHKNPMVETSLPSAARVSFLHQPNHKRYVAHLLYGPPIQRGRCNVIEDLPFLYNVPVTVNLPKKIKEAVLAPDMKKLEMADSHGKIKVTVPKFQCHCAVAFYYE